MVSMGLGANSDLMSHPGFPVLLLHLNPNQNASFQHGCLPMFKFTMQPDSQLIDLGWIYPSIQDFVCTFKGIPLNRNNNINRGN
jgi:hypothetical protein